MVENAHCQDIVEKRQVSRCQDCNRLAWSRHWGQSVLESLVIVRLEQGARHRKCSSDFSTIMWPVFSRLWQWSRKQSEAIWPVSASHAHRDPRSTRYHDMHYRQTHCHIMRESVRRWGASQQGTTSGHCQPMREKL